MDKSLDYQIRVAAFKWLSDRFAVNNGIFTWQELTTEFIFNGKVIKLIWQPGIWIPKGFDIPISITTSPNSPYARRLQNYVLKYSYRRGDINQRDNIGLREAFTNQTPLIYFEGIVPGKYKAMWPVIITDDNPSEKFVTANVGQMYSVGTEEMAVREIIYKEYVETMVRTRIHQPEFRYRVLTAYQEECALCGLKRHPELLDAAHIIADSDPDGKPEVPNGLSLCKIHHVSYDKKIIGITPDYEIKVSDKVMKEKDGPMLTYGLQSMNGRKLILPSKKSDHPDRDKLKRRWDEFIEFAV